MKYVKMIGLLAVAAAALMAFAGVASATTVTSNEGETPTVKASSEGHAKLVGPLGINVQCNSTVEGKVESHGAGVTAKGNLSSLTFTGCTNGYEVTVLAKGSLEIHSSNVLTSTGAEVTVKTPLGFNCIYRTNATDVGTLTESETTGGKATLDIGAKAIPRTGHSGLCGATGEWSGSYIVNSPTTLNVD
jgi:hypothetical protein